MRMVAASRRVAFAFAGALAVGVHAASGTVFVTATVVSVTDVAATAATQVLFGTSIGSYTLSIPGASGWASGEGTGGAAAGGLALTSTDGTTPSSEQLAALAVSDGTLSGPLGVSLSLGGAGGTQLVAIVAYN